MIVSQSIDEMDMGDVSSTLRGMVMYVAGDRFVPGGTTVLSGDSILELYRLASEVVKGGELARNISKVGYEDLKTEGSDGGFDFDMAISRISDALSGILSDLGCGLRILNAPIICREDTEEEQTIVAENVLTLLRYRGAFEIMSQLPVDYFIQRMRLSVLRLGGSVDEQYRKDHGYWYLVRLLSLPVWFSDLPGGVRNQIDYDLVEREIHMLDVARLCRDHDMARAMASFNRNPRFDGVEIVYEEVDSESPDFDDLSMWEGMND